MSGNKNTIVHFIHFQSVQNIPFSKFHSVFIPTSFPTSHTNKNWSPLPHKIAGPGNGCPKHPLPGPE